MQSAQRTLMLAADSPSIFGQSDSDSETGAAQQTGAGQEQADSDSETDPESESDLPHGQDQTVFELEEDELTDGEPSEYGSPAAQRRRITTPSPEFRDLNFEELGKSAALWINGLLDRRVLHFD